jgi:hypothetical protein
MAMVHLQAVDMPQGVSALKFTIVAFYPITVFEGRFTIGHRYILQSQFAGSEQRSLATKTLIFNQFHRFCILSATKIQKNDVKGKNEIDIFLLLTTTLTTRTTQSR